MKKLLILAVALVVLLSFWQVSLASGTGPPLPNICVDLEKTGPETARPGETITYHFRVHNCGDLPLLSGGMVFDNLFGESPIWQQNPFGPGEVADFDMTYTLPGDFCGEFTNRACAIGHNPDGLPSVWVQDIDSWTVDVICAPGTGTPGYWMNHPEAWPVDVITIGGNVYTKDEAIGLMKDPVKRDKTFTMFPALVAAKLNVLVGNDDSCIADTIAAADAWMAANAVGSGVKGSSEAWKMGEPLYEELDAYNNGKLCAPSRDALE